MLELRSFPQGTPSPERAKNQSRSRERHERELQSPVRERSIPSTQQSQISQLRAQADALPPLQAKRVYRRAINQPQGPSQAGPSHAGPSHAPAQNLPIPQFNHPPIPQRNPPIPQRNHPPILLHGSQLLPPFELNRQGPPTQSLSSQSQPSQSGTPSVLDENMGSGDDYEPSTQSSPPTTEDDDADDFHDTPPSARPRRNVRRPQRYEQTPVRQGHNPPVATPRGHNRGHGQGAVPPAGGGPSDSDSDGNGANHGHGRGQGVPRRPRGRGRGGQGRGQGLHNNHHAFLQPYDDGVEYPDLFLGTMTVQCSHCGALHWMVEKWSNSSMIHPVFGRCCQRGKVSLPSMRTPPEPLYSLLSMQLDYNPNYFLPAVQRERSRNYLNNIRKYNAAFAFISLGVKIDERITGAGGGPYAFRIHGQLSHLHGALLPEVNSLFMAV